MRAWVCVFLLAVSCSKPNSEVSSSESKPAPKAQRELNHPKFAATKQAAVPVQLPADSGPLVKTGFYAVKAKLKKGETARVRVLIAQANVKVQLYRFSPAEDGLWSVENSEMSSVEPGAEMAITWEAPIDGEQLIAVESVPESDLRLVLERAE